MMRRALCQLAALGGLVLAGPALAQDHAHGEHAAVAPEQAPTAHDQMDHGQMDHSQMDHAETPPAEVSPGPTLEMPPPPAAGSGPPRAADAIWGAEAMHDARHREHSAHGDFPVLWIQADRLETRAGGGTEGFLWDVQGYYGGPVRRMWFKSEGEGAFGHGVEDASLQALWSRAVAPYWDLQIGLRQDLTGPAATHAVIGLQGLAPYLFEVDAAAFVSQRGDVTFRVEAENDQRITQRLILQPRIEVRFAAQDVPLAGIGAGLDRAELGLRLRYEFSREFAPYVGIEHSRRFGGSAAHARAAGEKPGTTSVVAGLRVWF